MTDADPDFFRKRAAPAEPHFLFIGCSDSRVPADLLTGTLPGERVARWSRVAQLQLTGGVCRIRNYSGGSTRDTLHSVRYGCTAGVAAYTAHGTSIWLRHSEQ